MMNRIETELKERFERSVYSQSGKIEELADRVERLENALSHCMAFIADQFRLTEAEINGENGLTDF